MALTNAEKQASWRERNLKNENKLRAQFIFGASTRQGAAQTDRQSQGRSATSVIKEWAVSAERWITLQLSGKAAKAILRWRIDESSPMSAVIRYNQNNCVHQ